MTAGRPTAIEKLHTWKKNPRLIKDERFKALCNSIEKDPEFMELRPILATKDGEIYAGNMRYRACKELGWKEVPAIFTDIDETLAAERAIKDNNQFGEWDDTLSTLIDELEQAGVELDQLGLDEAIENLTQLEPEIEEDTVPEPKKDPQTGLGDLWQLGNHRLLCGDATNIEHIERLMDGEKADMVFTDPPYGMDLKTDNSNRIQPKGDWKNRAKNYDSVIGDNEDYDPNFVMGYFHDVAEQFWWGADYYAQRIPNKDSGSWLVWDKKASVENVEYTSAEFELCWSRTKHARKIIRIPWFGLIGTEQEHDHKRSHPTQKPANLCKWFIERYSEEEKLVADVYGGSGSTLIACEQLNRKCYMMELDPQYVRVIIDRWEKLTGEKAILLNKDGK